MAVVYDSADKFEGHEKPVLVFGQTWLNAGEYYMNKMSRWQLILPYLIYC